MKGFEPLPREHFQRYSEDPVKILPYDPGILKKSAKLLAALQLILRKSKLKMHLRGSTAYKIAGVGDIEYSVYPSEKQWQSVIDMLNEYFSTPKLVRKEVVIFEKNDNGVDFGVMVLKGKAAEIDKRVHAYLMAHKKLLKEYENLKYKYRYSKRAYKYHKYLFIKEVTEAIPE